MICHSSQRDFKGMVHHKMIKYCSATSHDVKNAYKIFGPDLAGIRGKTKRKNREGVDGLYRYTNGDQDAFKKNYSHQRCNVSKHNSIHFYNWEEYWTADSGVYPDQNDKTVKIELTEHDKTMCPRRI